LPAPEGAEKMINLPDIFFVVDLVIPINRDKSC